ncbi:MAG: VWA domain-containing protein [Planctomycetes bacterium]|nr:VWA domain-containing protein [Planctomycetota bacterium]
MSRKMKTFTLAAVTAAALIFLSGCAEKPANNVIEPVVPTDQPQAADQRQQVAPPPVAEEPAQEDAPAAEPSTAEPAESSIPSLRPKSFGSAPAADLLKGLSEQARKFHDHLAEVAAGKKVEHPDATQVMEEKSGMLFGAANARAGGVRMALASAAPMAAGAAPGMDGLGITAGGMQDIGQARKLIAEGGVPAPAMFTAEGLLSEHDIPLDGLMSGDAELYASASLAWTRRYGHDGPEAVVQIGFGVDMQRLDFHRPPLNLAVVVDVSGSMQGGKIEATRKALSTLIARLGENDRLAIVLFNNTAWVPMKSQVMTDAAKNVAAETAKGIQAGGGTSIESGLKFGYEEVAQYLGETEKSPRVLLMTDACPNVGATTAEGFMPMIEGAAAKGIGLGAFGVGIDFGQDLAYKIFQVRGANYFYLENDEKIAKVFDEEFDFMVTPAAYDVRIMLLPAAGAEVTDVLGVPDYTRDAEGVELKIPSLFFSKRQGGGATMVALKLADVDPVGEKQVAFVDLTFQPVGSPGKVHQQLEVFLPAGMDPEGKTPYYSQPGAKKALLLTDATLALKVACAGQKAPARRDIYWLVRPAGAQAAAGRLPQPLPGPAVTIDPAKAAEAAAGLGRFADWFAEMSWEFPALENELRLMEKLQANLLKTAGMPPVQPRNIPDHVDDETPAPEVEVF